MSGHYVALALGKKLRYNVRMCLENLDYLRDLIAREQQTRTLKAIAAEASVGESWLRMFMRGKIPDPGYSKVTRLLSTLRKH